jgi:enoyl-CoA hydratase
MPAAHDEPERYQTRGPVALVTVHRPEYRNVQESAMTYGLDRALYRAAEDNEIKVVILAGSGKHFSAGHDIGTPERDAHLPFDRKAGLWWDHSDKTGAESRFARESEVYPGNSVFGLHHLAHAHNAETAPDSLGGMDIRAMKGAGT